MKKILLIVFLLLFIQTNCFQPIQDNQRMSPPSKFLAFSNAQAASSQPAISKAKPKILDSRYVKKMELKKLIELKHNNKEQAINFDEADINFQIAEILYDLEYYEQALKYYYKASIQSVNSGKHEQYQNTLNVVMHDFLAAAHHFYNEQDFILAYRYFKLIANQNFDLDLAEYAKKQIKDIKTKIYIKRSPLKKAQYYEDEELENLNLHSEVSNSRFNGNDTPTNMRLSSLNQSPTSGFSRNSRPHSVPVNPEYLIVPIARSNGPTPTPRTRRSQATPTVESRINEESQAHSLNVSAIELEETNLNTPNPSKDEVNSQALQDYIEPSEIEKYQAKLEKALKARAEDSASNSQQIQQILSGEQSGYVDPQAKAVYEAQLQKALEIQAKSDENAKKLTDKNKEITPSFPANFEVKSKKKSRCIIQ